jgi:hypothetical protein
MKIGCFGNISFAALPNFLKLERGNWQRQDPLSLNPYLFPECLFAWVIFGDL